MKKISIIIILFSLTFTACELTEFDGLQQSPNNLAANQGNPNFLVNNIQVEFEGFIQDLNRTTDEVMRYTTLNDAYTEVADDGTLDGEWDNLYEMREDAKVLEALAADNPDLLFHRGITKVLTAYATATLVDYLGDIPFSEANNAAVTFDPSVDDDAVIYSNLLDEIDLAIADFESATVAPTTDLYFGGDADKWVKMANSLKLKMLINIGDQSGINALLAQDNFIETAADDFQFNYSAVVDPSSQHPDFASGYPVGGIGTYLGNSFLSLLKDSKAAPDPRIRYYIFRQANQDPTGANISCAGNPIFDFCYVGNFYIGRDHGDVRPGASDRETRSTYGLYPVGGTFDENNPGLAINTSHQEGAGINPILLSSFVDFLKAEAALSLGTTGDPAALLESAIRKSMDKVLNFKGAALGSAFAATSAQVDAYVMEVMTTYNVATNEDKLDIILEEYYLASFGNSTESYNGYRRTGFPSSLQVPVLNASVPFPRTFSLPRGAINNNNSLTQRPITNQVFWDTNPAGFIQ